MNARALKVAVNRHELLSKAATAPVAPALPAVAAEWVAVANRSSTPHLANATSRFEALEFGAVGHPNDPLSFVSPRRFHASA